MKALTLHQPFASLVAVDAKKIETRSWGTSYHGWLAIHAGKSTDYLGLLDEEPYRGTLMAAGFETFRQHEWDWLRKRDFPLGAIIAVANLHCVRRIDHWQNGEIHIHGKEWAVGGTEQAFGDYAPGRFGWVLTNVWRLPEPIPCRGAQGLWEVPAEIEARIREQIGGHLG